jgi:anthranilate phosphoribosyltransferase
VSTAAPIAGPVPAAAPATPFSAAPYLRDIGRGKDGSRALPRERARELMDAILAGTVGDLALGGVLLALRMKGEAASEIAGFLDALDPHLGRAPAAAPAWVILPSYNGARTHANLLPLLAMLLARQAIPVLVHGQASEPANAARPRVTSAAIFAALGMAPCARIEEAAGQAARGLPAVLALETFAPALARLIGLRAVLGVRNVAHTLAKLVRPVAGPSLLVSSYTHPDFGRLQAELFAQTGAFAMSMRGTDGEAVISARRAQGVDLWRDGHCTRVIEGESVARGAGELPAPDAESTAGWIRDVLDGRQPVPASLAAQCEAIGAAVRACSTSPDCSRGTG